LIQLLTVAAGGALGAVLRFLMSANIYRVFGRDFPYGTLAVNVIGSLLMGFFFALIMERAAISEAWRGVIIIGFLGAFTTFSTFSMETMALIESGALMRAAMNILLSVALCLLATWAGLQIGRQIF